MIRQGPPARPATLPHAAAGAGPLPRARAAARQPASPPRPSALFALSPPPCPQIWHRRASHRAFGGCAGDDYEEDLNWTRRLEHNWDLAAVKDVAARLMAGLNRGRDHEKRIRWLDEGTEHPHRIAMMCPADLVEGLVAELEEEVGRDREGKWGVKVRGGAQGAGLGWGPDPARGPFKLDARRLGAVKGWLCCDGLPQCRFARGAPSAGTAGV
jgi:hypothetical protein